MQRRTQVGTIDGTGQVGQDGRGPDQYSDRRGDDLQVHAMPYAPARAVLSPITGPGRTRQGVRTAGHAGSADLGAAVSLRSPSRVTNQHRDPLDQGMRVIEYGRARNQRGPEPKSSGRQSSRPAQCRGPRLLRRPAITRSVANLYKVSGSGGTASPWSDGVLIVGGTGSSRRTPQRPGSSANPPEPPATPRTPDRRLCRPRRHPPECGLDQ